MKAILEFDLPKEAYQHMIAANAGELAEILRNLDATCRLGIKHGSNHNTVEECM